MQDVQQRRRFFKNFNSKATNTLINGDFFNQKGGIFKKMIHVIKG